ncbi:MAG: imidazole glycerol phosphate synthase subunit HisH [Deltaproteobacteria bacterium]|nr:MAG: imidazole glycerol phosphate synthase subunit HisH [Deltaproteobacteria bacterium]
MIAIIDYDAGNLASVARAVSYVGFKAIITNDKFLIKKADRIIFPGVGAAGSAMDSLKRLGLDKIILDVFKRGKPVLGICLGTQIIMGKSEENDTQCLKIVNGNVQAFPAGIRSENNCRLKIPHMGWNGIKIIKNHPVFSGVGNDDEFYFVHGFYPDPVNKEDILATTDYGITFASVIGFKNIIATQFHLEKSGKSGLTMLKNFCEWEPC